MSRNDIVLSVLPNLRGSTEREVSLLISRVKLFILQKLCISGSGTFYGTENHDSKWLLFPINIVILYRHRLVVMHHY